MRRIFLYVKFIDSLAYRLTRSSDIEHKAWLYKSASRKLEMLILKNFPELTLTALGGLGLKDSERTILTKSYNKVYRFVRKHKSFDGYSLGVIITKDLVYKRFKHLFG